jgi:hypothetical protein
VGMFWDDLMLFLVSWKNWAPENYVILMGFDRPK